MRREERFVQLPTAPNETSAPTNTAPFEQMWIDFDGSWTGNFTLEGLLSTDLTNWQTIAASVTSPAAIIAVTVPYAQIRVNGTAALTALGTLKGKVCSFNPRTK